MSVTNGIDIVNFIENTFNIKLPEEGFLAGQSVCSVYLYLNKKIKDVHINDIDVFHNVNHYTYYQIANLRNFKFQQLKSMVTITRNEMDIILNNQDYISEPKIILNLPIKHISSFEYVHSERLGLLNLIYYKGSKTNCLEHFDINCTKIGVDLKTKKLIKLKDFIDFEKKLEIKITNFDTPFHSIIRLSSKIDQFQFNSSLEENILLTNSVIDSLSNFSKKHSFGKKYKEKINPYIIRHYSTENFLEDKLFKLKPRDKEKFDINEIKKYFNYSDIKYHNSNLNFYIINNLRFLYERYKENNKNILFMLNNPLNKQKLVYEYLTGKMNNFEKLNKVIKEDFNNFNLSTNSNKNKEQEKLLRNEYIGHLNFDVIQSKNLLEIIYFYEKKYNINLKSIVNRISISLFKENYVINLSKILQDFIDLNENSEIISTILYKKQKINLLIANSTFCLNNNINKIYSINQNYIYEIHGKFFGHLNEVSDYLNSINIKNKIEKLIKKFEEKYKFNF